MKINFKDKKLWIILSAIASILVIAIVALIIFFSTGDVLASKKKKKIIKVIKKTDTSQTDDTSSDDTNSFDDYYDVDFNTGEEITSSDDEEEEKPKSPYDVKFDGVANAPANKQIGMSIYHYDTVGKWAELTKGEFGDESEFLNYYHVSSVLEAKKVKEMGGMCWLHIRAPFDRNDKNNLTLPSNWTNSINQTVEAYKSAGLWDCIAGFHTEEMMLQITGEQYRITTKYLNDNWPEKRIYCCISLYELKGSNGADPMSYKTYGYVTDIGFDYYFSYDYNYFKDLVNHMKEGVGRDDVRIWFYPTAYGSNTSEDFMINHLNQMYKLLLEEENPGGLDLYTWKTWGENSAGLDRLLDPDGQYKYDNLAKRIVEIGKEIKNNPYRYEKLVN